MVAVRHMENDHILEIFSRKGQKGLLIWTFSNLKNWQDGVTIKQRRLCEELIWKKFQSFIHVKFVILVKMSNE